MNESHCIRCVLQEAAQSYDMELGHISFKGTLDTVRHFADALRTVTGTPRRKRQICEEMLQMITWDPQLWRPNRNHPRARKRCPSNTNYSQNRSPQTPPFLKSDPALTGLVNGQNGFTSGDLPCSLGNEL